LLELLLELCENVVGHLPLVFVGRAFARSSALLRNGALDGTRGCAYRPDVVTLWTRGDIDMAEERSVESRLRMFTRALVAVTVVAVAALGVAVWALIDGSRDDDRRPRAATVRALAARVHALEAQVARTPPRVVVSIRDEQRSLDERLAAVEHDTRTAIDALRQDIDDLQHRVDELDQQPERPSTAQR
jgi:hypothetical protein